MRAWLPAFPHGHFMAPAPIDVWLRLFATPGVTVRPRFLLRLGFALAASGAGTILTLPERLITGLLIGRAYRRSRGRLDHGPGVVIVLGYYRTGTTHLHYLLSCDPRFHTPRWRQAMAPQGFLASWAVIQIAMAPFLSNNRPQDDVSIGPEWPAEDDFATSNWALASALPGRLVAPSAHEHFARFHDLERLTDAERERWRLAQFGFLWKMSRLAGPRRMILLKTPSHTARVRALCDLLGEENVRFVHLSRDPDAVIRSNVRMAERLSSQLITDPADPEQVRERVTREYIDTERKYDREREALSADRVVEIRYEDLVANPLAVVRTMYERWGIEWSEDAQARMRRYLAQTRGYKAASMQAHGGGLAATSRGGGLPARDEAKMAAPHKGEGGGLPARDEAKMAAPREEGGTGFRPVSHPANEAQPDLDWLRHRFRHDEPPLPQGPEIPDPPTPPAWRVASRWIGAMLATVTVVVGAWLAIDWWRSSHRDWLIFPAAYAIGRATLLLSSRGSWRKGVFAATLALVIYLAMAPAGLYVAEYVNRPPAERTWANVSDSARRTLTNEASLLWAGLGVLVAYRLGSRRHAHPPGR